MEVGSDIRRAQAADDLRTIFSKSSIKPVEHQSLIELGSLFIDYFREAAIIYEVIFRDAKSLSEPFITNHQQLRSFQHLNRVASEARGLSASVDLLHQEFRNLSYRITQCLVPELELRLGPDERHVDCAVGVNDRGELDFHENRPPGSDAIARLEQGGIFWGIVSDDSGTKYPLKLDNSISVGKKGQSVLHTALALRDQSISGFDQPLPVFTWLRDTVGLQDSVFVAMLQLRQALVEALSEQYPHLSPFQTGLDVPLSARQEISRSICRETHRIQWADSIWRIFSPVDSDPERFSLKESVENLGDVQAPYRVTSRVELGSILYALGKSIPLNHPEYFDCPKGSVSEEMLIPLKRIALEIAQSALDSGALQLAETARTLVVAAHSWARSCGVPHQGAERVLGLLDQWSGDQIASLPQ